MNKDDTNDLSLEKDVEEDPFLRSMTFAVGGSSSYRDCDCDECFVGGNGSVRLPATIREAVAKHKRQKLMETPVRRTQHRTLVARKQQVSLWRLTMPVDAEPLIEFGSSHRIVFIRTLSEGSKILSIGEGVVGSRNEESTRSVVNWTSGEARLIPSNGGKAVGWLHAPISHMDDDSESKPTSHVVVYIFKIPVDVCQDASSFGSSNGEDERSPCWSRVVSEICRKALAQRPESLTSSGFRISQSDSNIVEEVLKDLILSSKG